MASTKPDYSAFASGQVFYSRPGFVAFPVDLASTIFLKCRSILQSTDLPSPYTIYDPCCGSGQMLTTLGFLFGDAITDITGSDINPKAIDLAKKNIGLLSEVGITQRIEELQEMVNKFGKESHKKSVQDAILFRDTLHKYTKSHPINTRVFQTDITNSPNLATYFRDRKVDLVISDLPYGKETSWQTNNDSDGLPIYNLLASLLPILSPQTIVALATNRQQTVEHPLFTRIGLIKAAGRRIYLLKTR